jgi:hypothetical protein
VYEIRTMLRFQSSGKLTHPQMKIILVLLSRILP